MAKASDGTDDRLPDRKEWCAVRHFRRAKSEIGPCINEVNWGFWLSRLH